MARAERREPQFNFRVLGFSHAHARLQIVVLLRIRKHYVVFSVRLSIAIDKLGRRYTHE